MALKITVVNYSNTDWTRWRWKYAAGKSDTIGNGDQLINTPAETIEKQDGSTIAKAESYMLSWLVQDCLYIDLGYQAGSDVFGVSLRHNFQLFTIGKGISWRYFKDNKWHNADRDSSIITWTFPAHTIVATPSLSHQDASIEVLIKNSNK